MRPRRPYIASLADVTIVRSGESAVITYRRTRLRMVTPTGFDGVWNVQMRGVVRDV